MVTSPASSRIRAAYGTWNHGFGATPEALEVTDRMPAEEQKTTSTPRCPSSRDRITLSSTSSPTSMPPTQDGRKNGLYAGQTARTPSATSSASFLRASGLPP